MRLWVQHTRIFWALGANERVPLNVRVMLHEQGKAAEEDRYSWDKEMVSKEDVPEAFNAVMSLERQDRMRSGDLWWWEARSPQLLGGRPVLVPMPSSALLATVKRGLLQERNVADGAWVLRKHGGYIGVHPVLEGEA